MYTVRVINIFFVICKQVLVLGDALHSNDTYLFCIYFFCAYFCQQRKYPVIRHLDLEILWTSLHISLFVVCVRTLIWYCTVPAKRSTPHILAILCLHPCSICMVSKGWNKCILCTVINVTVKDRDYGALITHRWCHQFEWCHFGQTTLSHDLLYTIYSS